MENPEELVLYAKFNGNKIEVKVSMDDTIGDLKKKLSEMTNVLQSRQKLVGIIRGKFPEDTAKISELNIADQHTFILLGTPEKNLFIDPSEVPDLPDVIDDFDFIDTTYDTSRDPENLRLQKSVTEKLQVTFINPPRENKKLLVLDLDYCVFDCKTVTSDIVDVTRPGLHEMLATYNHYDIAVWSQTSWKWLEMKITEMGMLTHSRYKISFVLDKTCMYKVKSKKKNSTAPYFHHVKDLNIIWKKFPDRWGSYNTIHIDDLERNFAMNRKNGLKVTAFKNGPVTRQTDKDLFHLTMYLMLIADSKDISSLDLHEWKRSAFNPILDTSR